MISKVLQHRVRQAGRLEGLETAVRFLLPAAEDALVKLEQLLKSHPESVHKDLLTQLKIAIDLARQ